MKYFILAIIILLPFGTFAQVSVSEVAWMGTTASSTNEWIELYNDSDTAVDLTGWTLSTPDNKLAITLAGSVGAKSFYLIERTDDTTVPDVTADLIAAFGGGLSNSGETLVLKNSSSATVDTLSFSSGWPAGDNITKDTMQKSGTSWITATPSPKSGGTGQSASTTTGGLPAPSAKEKEAPKKPIFVPGIYFTIPEKSLRGIPIALPWKVMVGETERISHGVFVVSTGDGYVSKTMNGFDDIEHTYLYPGKYVITFSYFETPWSRKPRYVKSATITIVEPTVVLSRYDENIEISTTGKEDLSLSGWSLSDGVHTFDFPEGMVIAEGAKIVLPKEYTHLNSGNPLTLSYPDGKIFYTKDERASAEGSNALVPTLQAGVPNNVDVSLSVPERKNANFQSVFTSENPAEPAVIDLTASVGNAVPERGTNSFITPLLVGMLGVGGVAWLRFKYKKAPEKKDLDEFTLVDE